MSLAPLYFLSLLESASLRLHKLPSGEVVATQPLPEAPGDFAFELAGLGLADGDHVLGVSAINEYGDASLVTQMAVDVQSGTAYQPLLEIRDLVAYPIGAGLVALEWIALPTLNLSGQAEPAEYEIAYPSAPTLVADTIQASGLRQYRATADESGIYYVRASDGAVDGRRGPWAASNDVTVDVAAPPAPEFGGGS